MAQLALLEVCVFLHNSHLPHKLNLRWNVVCLTLLSLWDESIIGRRIIIGEGGQGRKGPQDCHR